MTTKRTTQQSSGLVEHFPERPPRKDMQNWIHIGIPGHLSALARHLGNPDTTIVICEPALGRNLSQRTGLLYTDLLVAFNANRDHAFARLGYAMDVQGKPPEFVLEVGSPRTALNDYTTSGKDTPLLACRNTGASTLLAGTGTPQAWLANGW